MSDGSKIEWTDATWNPVRGCIKISPGCKHCYAETLAERFRGVPGHPYEHGFTPRLIEEKLGEPANWSRSRRVFVNSMSDLFQDAVPDEFIRRVFETMATVNWHTYQLLTKRAARMAAVVRRLPRRLQQLPNVWLGVSVENRKYGLPRIDHLRRTPAAVRFLSIEPLLEGLGALKLARMDWVIVGGESGVGARAMEGAWVREIRDQCGEKAIPFFFKQWGGVRKSLAGRELDGRTHDDYPVELAHLPPSHDERRRIAALLGSPRRSLPFARTSTGEYA
jgi:protein gp37